jgi:GNAT acetyltransferase-like protein
MEVIQLTARDEDAYTAFVRSRPDGLLYHALSYRDLLVDHLGCTPEYLLAVDGGEVRGVLPVMWAEADGQRIANSLPFYGSHGSVLADAPAARTALLDAWNERAADADTAAATLVANPFSEDPLPDPVHDFQDERINQATALPASGIESSAQRNARRAHRLGVQVARDAGEMDALCRIHRANMAEIGGLAKTPDFFAAVARHFSPGDDYDVYVARLDDSVVAALLVFWFGAVAEYFTPATEHEHRSAQPMAAILELALEDAAARGHAWWNWGGTWLTQEGVMRFKRKWGARERPYRYFVKLNDRTLLDESPAALTDRFTGFYVVPFSSLRSEGAMS